MDLQDGVAAGFRSRRIVVGHETNHRYAEYMGAKSRSGNFVNTALGAELTGVD